MPAEELDEIAHDVIALLSEHFEFNDREKVVLLRRCLVIVEAHIPSSPAKTNTKKAR